MSGMVSTRSQSVLSAEAAHGDTAASHGEVSSVAPTPRRSGRLRSSGTAATPTAEQAPPRTARTRRLRAIIEEQEQQGDVQEQQAEQQQEAAPGSQEPAKRGRRRSAAASPKSPAAGAASPAAAEEPQEEEEEQEKAGLQPLKARVALVDLLAEEMFAALNGAFGEREGGSSTSGSDEESGDAQEEGGAAARPDRQQDRAAAQADSSSSDGSDSDSEGEGRAGRDHVPRHLRWRPELTLPGMPGSSNQPAAQPGRGEPAAAAAAAMAAGVHVVRKGKQADSLHVPPPDERAAHRAARKAAPDTAGAAWFDLPATQITDEVKRDLRLLRLRCAALPCARACPALAQSPRRIVSCLPHSCSCWSYSRQGCPGPQVLLQEARLHQVPQVFPDGHGGGGRGRLLFGWVHGGRPASALGWARRCTLQGDTAPAAVPHRLSSAMRPCSHALPRPCSSALAPAAAACRPADQQAAQAHLHRRDHGGRAAGRGELSGSRI